MSHYNHTELPITSRKLILEALTNKEWGLGYSQEALDLTPNRQLEGYHGDLRPDRADITIKRKFLGSASNDLGFKETENGKWELIESDYDSGIYRGEKVGRGALKDFKQRFIAAYAQAKIRNTLQKRSASGWKMKETKMVGNMLVVTLQER